MASAARSAGARLAVQSAYRSYSNQKATFDYWVRVDGYATAIKESARAGHSEHQLGTTLDFRSYGGSAPWNYTRLGDDQGRCLAEGQRLEIRLHHVVPEGQVGRDVLRVRTVALPLRRAGTRPRRSARASSRCASTCGSSRPHHRQRHANADAHPESVADPAAFAESDTNTDAHP